jgi:hypothetical protein
LPDSRFVGTQIQLTVQVKFQTFTPDQFTKALNDKGFTVASAMAGNAQTGAAVPVQTFSKGNVVIFLLPSAPNLPPLLVFQILNTVNLNNSLSGSAAPNEIINDMLGRLNIVPDIVALIAFSCVTTVVTKTRTPIEVLTSNFKQQNLDAISKAVGRKLGVQTIRLGDAFPIERKGLQIILEPLTANPTKQYYVNILLHTDDQVEYSEFIRDFGEKQIDAIVAAVGGNNA